MPKEGDPDHCALCLQRHLEATKVSTKQPKPTESKLTESLADENDRLRRERNAAIEALRSLRRYFGTLEKDKSEIGRSAWQDARDAFKTLETLDKS